LSAELKSSAARPIVCYVTDGSSLASTADLLPNVRRALDCGADWIQIREKHLTAHVLLALSCEAVVLAQPARARIFVNDRLDVALAAGANGVHFGGESIPVAAAVQWCRTGNASPDFAVGASCHGFDDALAAERAGANYIFFGPVFETPSKRSFGAPQGLDRLEEICAALEIPVIAIGGVNQENAADCTRAGARGIAAIRLFQEDFKGEALRNFITNFHAS